LDKQRTRSAADAGFLWQKQDKEIPATWREVCQSRERVAMEKSGSKGLYTMLGEATLFEGSLIVPHSLRVDGRVKGRIETSEVLTVGRNGVVEADIKAKSAIIGGKVTGNIVVEDRVELEAEASLVGDIRTRDLIINEGAVFQGNCSMDTGASVKV
jgi:cytoskeletal protein CcmA (bactofilin family)